MLPYLDKFLYIGTKLERVANDNEAFNEREARLTAKATAEAQADNALEMSAELGSLRMSPRPETVPPEASRRNSSRSLEGDTWTPHDEGRHSGPAVSFRIDDSDDLFFNRSLGDGEGVRHMGLAAGPLQLVTASSRSGQRRSRASIGGAPTPVDALKRPRKETAADVLAVSTAGRVVSSARSMLSASALDKRVLSSRYVRFWDSARLDDWEPSDDVVAVSRSTRTRAAPVHPPPRVRSLPWLLQIIEEIYDSATAAERPTQVWARH